MFPISQDIVEQTRLQELEGRFAPKSFNHQVPNEAGWKAERTACEMKAGAQEKETIKNLPFKNFLRVRPSFSR